MKKYLANILGGLIVLLGGVSVAHATGAYPVAVGGTGNTTFPVGSVLVGNGTSPLNTATLSSIFPFTPSTNFNVNTSATTTALWAKAGLFASTTSQFDYATTTGLTVTGTQWLPGITSTGLAVDSVGKVYGAATTTFSTGLIYTNGVVTNPNIFEWTPSTNFNANSNATTTPIWLKNGLQASTTSQFAYSTTTMGSFTLASTTNLNITGLANTATNCLQVSNQGVVSATGSACGGGSGSVTSITLGGGLDGASPITTTGTIIAQIGTSTTPTVGNVAYWTGAGTPSTLGTVGTTTLSVTSAPFSFPSTLSVLGSGTGSYWGLSTTSNGVAGNIPYWTGAASMGTIATGTITCSGTGISCSTAGLSVIGGALTITGSGVPFGFTPTTNFGVNTSATSTPLNSTAGIMASSTSYFTLLDTLNGINQNGALLAYASSTNADTIFGLAAMGGNATTSNTFAGNTAVGYTALKNLGTGNHNTAVGYLANGVDVTGSNNTAVGYSALSGNTGNYNTALGLFAGYSITSGYDNIMLGQSLEQRTGLTTGYNNIFIGNHLTATSTNSANFLNIGNTLFGLLASTTNPTPVIAPYPASGFFSVGSTSPWAKLSVHANYGDTANTLFAVASSSLNATSTLFTVNNVGQVGAATTSPWALFSANASASGTTMPQFVVGSSTATNLIVANSGQVGVSTTTPSASINAALSVGGTIYSGSGGYVFPDGTTQTTAASAGGTTQTTMVFTAAESITADNAVASALYQATPVTLDTSGAFTTKLQSTATVVIGSNTNRCLIVMAAMPYQSSFTFSGDYNGTSITWTQADVGSGHLAIGYVVAPTTGSHTLTVSNGAGGGSTVTWYSLYNCDQTTPINASNYTDVSATSGTVSATSVTDGDIAVGMVAGLNASASIGTPAGNVYTANTFTGTPTSWGPYAAGDSGLTTQYGGGTSYTMSFSGGSASWQNAIIVGVIKAAAAPVYAVQKASSASANSRATFVGFAQGSASAGGSVTVTTGGVHTFASGSRIATNYYYLNDTQGTIGIAAGTVTHKVGIALSSLKMLITNIW